MLVKGATENKTILASDDGVSPVQHKAIIRNNDVTLLIGSS